MNNFEFNKDMFVKEDERKSIFRYIPGYRSNALIKKIIASIYYFFCVMFIFMSRNIGEVFLSVLLVLGFVFVCHINDLRLGKTKRDMETIKRHVGLPFVGMTLCFFAFGLFAPVFNPQAEAAKELGISLEEYNNVINKYNQMKNETKSIVETNKATKSDYENKQKEYDNLVKEFDEYKESISEESIKELDTLKSINENYKQQITDLEKEISELENKLN